MKPLHSEVFYYTIAVYVLGAAAMFALPSGLQQKAIANANTEQQRNLIVEADLKAMPVRNKVPAPTGGVVFAGTPSNF